MPEIIPIDRSVIPACDVDIERFKDILRETDAIPRIGAYKLGVTLALSLGLPKLVEIARNLTNKPLIYDHQKAGTDIPDMGGAFASVVKESGIDAIIIFPLSGPETQTAWIQEAKKAGLSVITGGYMTHKRYVVSEGGYIADSAVDAMFINSALQGISDYVVPGNKPEIIRHLRESLVAHGVDPVFYAPGFIAQGGEISEAASVAGAKWHAIVGRAVYDAGDIQKAAESLTSRM